MDREAFKRTIERSRELQVASKRRIERGRVILRQCLEQHLLIVERQASKIDLRRALR